MKSDRPLLLVTTAMPSLLTHRDPRAPWDLHPHLGRLVQPRHYSALEAMVAAGVPWGADNDCFQGLDVVRFVAMLDALQGVAGTQFVDGELVDRKASSGCAFVTVPDVVGDALATARQFEKWAPALERRGLPVALVLQDGIEDLPEWLARTWHRLDAVFVGGSTEWKLGPVARDLAQEAHARGKWVHWGRVNTQRRIDYVVQTGAVDSLDGSKWARWRKTYLDAGLEYLRNAWGTLELPLIEPLGAVA